MFRTYFAVSTTQGVRATSAVLLAVDNARLGGRELTAALREGTLIEAIEAMELERARESLRAAVLCLQEGCENSAASRAYYAMFQAAQVALAHVGAGRMVWSHHGLQAAFTTELIHRRKRYPASLRNYLISGLEVRQAADYGHAGVSRKVAQRLVHRASAFVAAVEEGLSHGLTT